MAFSDLAGFAPGSWESNAMGMFHDDLWNIELALCFSHRFMPPEYDDVVFTSREVSYGSGYSSDRARQIIAKAIEAGKLIAVKKNGGFAIMPATFATWASSEGWNLPPELKALVIEEIGSEKLTSRQSTGDRERVRLVCSVLWIENPKLSIEAMTSHPTVLKLGNGSQYIKNTLRGWIKDLTPHKSLNRPGRPRKTPADPIK